MTQVSTSLPPDLSESDWAAARESVHSCLSRRLAGFDASLIEEQTQEATIRLIRVLRRERTRNLTGLIRHICQKVATDFLRKEIPLRGRTEALADHEEPVDVAASDPFLRYECERLCFMALQYFRENSPSCHKLAVALYSGQTWVEVAAASGRKPSAVRKQWSRCAASFRRVLAQHPDPIVEWARG